MWAAARAADATGPDAAARCMRCTAACCSIAFRDPIDLGSLAVDGDDLRRAGIPAGPELGKILQIACSPR